MIKKEKRKGEPKNEQKNKWSHFLLCKRKKSA